MNAEREVNAEKEIKMLKESLSALKKMCLIFLGFVKILWLGMGLCVVFLLIMLCVLLCGLIVIPAITIIETPMTVLGLGVAVIKGDDSLSSWSGWIHTRRFLGMLLRKDLN